MAHYLDRFINAKIKIERNTKDPDTVGAFGPDETGPVSVYQDLICYLSKKNATENYIAAKYIGEDVYQILIKAESLDVAKPIEAETDTVEVTEYNGSATHPFIGKYRIAGYDPERGRNARANLHAKLFLTRVKSVDDVADAA